CAFVHQQLHSFPTRRSSDLINALVQDIIDEQIDSFKDRQQKIVVSIPDESTMALVDEMRFRMVIENIIDNASKYTPHSGKVTVRSEEHTSELQSRENLVCRL